MDNNEIKDGDYTQYYEILDKIGEGQFGEVFKGINKKSKEIRAIKIIKIKNIENNNFIKYIYNELNNMKICSEENDNSVKYYEHFHNKDKFIIVMELCDNSLQKILDDRKEGFTSEQIFNIMNQLNNTFKIMNKNKIIHTDIKLDNILIKYIDKNNNDSDINFIVKLTDYGISKQLENTNTTFIGTFQTMAPEILEGKENYDNKCDLWSIGIIIYQLFSKEYPYKGTPVAIYNQIKKLGKKFLRRTKDDKLDNLIDSLLIREPEKRINYEDYFNHPFFNKENYIESEIEIEYINKDRKLYIINEHFEEIKEYCEISINNEIIPFSYFYKFKNIGKYKIKYSFKRNLKKTDGMFLGCDSLTNINLSNFNTKNVTNMNSMFSECFSLTNINLSNFNTQNVTDMKYMFCGCESLININLSNFNTKNVTNMNSMFVKCVSLTNINLSNFNTKNVTDMSYMFSGCKSLININLSNFNTQNVTNMSYMLSECFSLTNINLSNFNTQNVIDMSYMFSECKSLININLSSFNTQNVIDMSYMFCKCESLTTINLYNFNTQKVYDMSYMFFDCSNLTNINLSNFNTQFTNICCMFLFCHSLTEKQIISKDENILKIFRK